MRKLLNTLYVTTPESYLSRDGQNVVVLLKGEEKFRIPVHNIEGIVCFGYMGASPGLIGLCSENNVGLTFATENGWFLGRFIGKVNGNVLLRRKQFRMADSDVDSINIARIVISGKLANSRNADRLVLSLINRKQVNCKGFIHQETSGVIMTDETRKEIISAWQKRKQESIVHPFLKEEISIGLLPYVQSLLLARFLRGDLDNYPVFIMK